MTMLVCTAARSMRDALCRRPCARRSGARWRDPRPNVRHCDRARTARPRPECPIAAWRRRTCGARARRGPCRPCCRRSGCPRDSRAPWRARPTRRRTAPRVRPRLLPVADRGVEQAHAVEIACARRWHGPSRRWRRPRPAETPRRCRGCACSRCTRAWSADARCVPAPCRRRERRRARTARPCPRGELHAGVRAARARFVQHDMRLDRHDHSSPWSSEQFERRLVRHRARGHEQRRLLAEQRGNAFLQTADGGILAILVVADLGLGHGAAHAGDGLVTVSERRSIASMGYRRAVASARPPPCWRHRRVPEGR